ncbi:hypothetical protein QYF36_008060 [Acer negundo]|nr:hypothetical protein QYF36_008060 [Acer negundo]
MVTLRSEAWGGCRDRVFTGTESFRKSSQSSYSGSRADPLVKRKSLEKTSCLEKKNLSVRLVSRAKVANS